MGDGTLPDDLDKIVSESIESIVKSYSRPENKILYLTEGDVVASLYSILRDRLKGVEDVTVHSQLRPYDARSKEVRVIGEREKKMQWKTQSRANDGSIVDIIVIDSDESYWKDACRKAKKDQGSRKLKYWRIVSYPVKAFRAAIEVKVKVRSNFSGIRRDVKKLETLKEADSDCLLFLVVLDRRASVEDLDEVKRGIGDESRVRVHTT